MAGTAEPCFVSSLLDEYEKELLIDPTLQEDVKMLGGATYTGESFSTLLPKIYFTDEPWSGIRHSETC